MSLRQNKKLRPLLRVLAAGTLFAWLSALGLCAHLCSTTEASDAAESSHCHANADADSHHHHDGDDHDTPAPSHHGPCASSSCLTLQNALLGSKIAALHPDLSPLYALPAFAPTLQSANAPAQVTFRHAKPRDWVFTPEVSLGPAFRSLAPPVI